jgi:hypothetical protein
MGMLFDIFIYSFGNIPLGIFITIVGVGLMFFIIKSWFANRTFSLISLFIGMILFFFLSFQSILLCGAVTIRSYCPEVETAINTWEKNTPSNVELTPEDSQKILEQIQGEWPIVSRYISGADFRGYNSRNIGHAMASELRSHMNWYILRRTGWCLFFVILGAAIVIRSMENNGARNSHSRSRTTRRIYED